MTLAAATLALIALADPFCADVAKLAEGAREPIPFQTLRDADFKPQLLRFGCFPGGEGYFCQQSKLPPELTEQATATRIAACLPGAKIAAEKQPGSRAQTVVTGAGARFQIEESGAAAAPTGRILRIQVVSDR
jgi:hypothetical protein